MPTKNGGMGRVCHQRKYKADMSAQSVRVSAHVCSPLLSLQESHLRGRAQGGYRCRSPPAVRRSRSFYLLLRQFSWIGVPNAFLFGWIQY
jgi:hypothetical protein